MTVELDKIYNEDCMATMFRMPDKMVDLVLTSPPYNMNLRVRNGHYCSRQIVKEFSTKYVDFADNLPIDVFYKTHSDILRQLIRVSRIVFYNIGIVTGSKRAFFKMIGEFHENLKEIIVWDKLHAQPAMHSGVLSRRSELILVFENTVGAMSRQFSKANFGRGTLDDVWQIKRGKTIKGHGAVFPMELARTVIHNFSNVGDIVYDPFMGSGTSAEAALGCGRRFIGSEISPEYCRIANKRILDVGFIKNQKGA